jgi:hypothetical protein
MLKLPDEKRARAEDKLKRVEAELERLKLAHAKAKRAAAEAERVSASKLKRAKDELKRTLAKLKLCSEPAPAPDAVPDEKHEQACESAITWWRLPRVIVRRGRCPMLTASGRRAPEFLCGPLPDANAYRGIRSFASKSQGTLSLTSWTSRSLRPEASLATRCPPTIYIYIYTSMISICPSMYVCISLYICLSICRSICASISPCT